jgi:predicted RNA-binding protein with TRAM domain
MRLPRRLLRPILTLGLALVAMAAIGLSSGTAGAAPTNRPGAPTGLAYNPYADGSTTLSWTAPTSDGGSAITGYQLAGKDGKAGGSCNVPATSTSCSVTGLKDGKKYKLKIRALNANGAGPYSAPLAVVVGLPDPPTAVKGTPGNDSVVVSWTPPARDNTSVTSYTVTASPGGATCTATGELSCTVTGLTNGDPYTFTVVSNDKYGSSLPSAASAPVTPSTVPGVPTGVSVSADTSPSPSALVTFDAPASNGDSPITGYTVVVEDLTTSNVVKFSAPVAAATVGTTSGTGYLVSPLVATQSYKFYVYATNAQGNSPSTSPVVAYPAGPTSVSAAVDGVGTAHVSFTPSNVTLGTPVTGFGVSYIDLTNFTVGTPTTLPASTTSTELTGLNVGDNYDVCIAAEQSALPGASETCTEFVESSVVPGAPTAVTVSADSSPSPSAEVNFTAPASDGGSAITGYTVVVDDTTTNTVTDDAAPVAAATVGNDFGTGYLVTGLTATDSYTFAVEADNTYGPGAASAPVSAYPAGPTSVDATGNGDGTADVSWTPSDVTLGTTVTGFEVSYFDFSTFTAGTPVDLPASTTSTELTGLNVGDTYDVCVAAQSALTGSNETCQMFTA